MATVLENALERLEVLGKISDHPNYLVRTYLSPANRKAALALIGWMLDLGMEVGHLPDGTVRGILPGTDAEAKPLLLGSHIDTVVNAGRYDGALGLISALAAVEGLQQRGIQLPYPIHLLGFSDEEGVRFQTTYLGSRSILGELDLATKTRVDAQGKSQAFVLATDGWHSGATPIHYERGDTRGYVELHIEQGRVLEEADEPACVVAGIVGQSRLLISYTGRADHAGTTPMDIRNDSLTGAAEAILEIEKMALAVAELVATVGKIEVLPGSANSIPEVTTFTIDFRHPDDGERLRLLEQLEGLLMAVAEKRSLALKWEMVQEDHAVPCDEGLTEALSEALFRVTGSRRKMVSGAGHDGVAISKVMPIGMIFVRCREGLSHHPDEYASPEDIEVGIEVLRRFLIELGDE